MFSFTPNAGFLTLGIFLFIFFIEYFYFHYSSHWLKYLITTRKQREEMKEISHTIKSLRMESNQLNSPSTFAEYALVQRKLNKSLKQQSQIMEATQLSWEKTMQWKIVLNIPRILAYFMILLLPYCFSWVSQGNSIVLAEIPLPAPNSIEFHQNSSIFLPSLLYSPIYYLFSSFPGLKYFHGSIGIFPWALLSYRITKRILTWKE